jgi:hypothetical protein
MKSKVYARWFTAGLCFATFAAWALLAVAVIRNQGDRMIGFHPAILGILPGVMVGAISAVILLVSRQWQIGLALGLGVLTLFLVLLNGRAIEDQAWQHTIALHAHSNEKAMADIQSDLNSDDLSQLWKEEKLSPLEGFQWYGKNHFSAPNGVYYGFRIGGVPHVRIQKIRHGWRGVALVHSDSPLTTLKARIGMRYSRVGSSDWFIWNTE